MPSVVGCHLLLVAGVAAGMQRSELLRDLIQSNQAKGSCSFWAPLVALDQGPAEQQHWGRPQTSCRPARKPKSCRSGDGAESGQ